MILLQCCCSSRWALAHPHPTKKRPPKMLPFHQKTTRPFLFLHLLLLPFFANAAVYPPAAPSPLLNDAVSLLTFKASGDLDNRLIFALTERFDYCQWRGVKCGAQNRVVRVAFPSLRLRGAFPPASLSRLDQLRVLNLRNNSLSGPIPDLSGLPNLRTLLLSSNAFSGAFPLSLLSLLNLQALALSGNSLAGPLPPALASLRRLAALRLDSNRFNGSLPPLRQPSLLLLNVSANNFSGRIPPALSRFDPSAFSLNPNLCGAPLARDCPSPPPPPLFGPSPGRPLPPPPSSSSGASQGNLLCPPAAKRRRHRNGIPVITGLCAACSVAVLSLLIFLALRKKLLRKRKIGKQGAEGEPGDSGIAGEGEAAVPSAEEAEGRLERKQKEEEVRQEEVGQLRRRSRRTGSLVFCEGEPAAFTMDQLMRASAEMLGRGSIGATYKAVMDNGLIVSVKRLDAGKTAMISCEAFERQMEAVCGLRHPNLVPVRAYFQANEERLIIYDFQPNGSLFSLIHGSRSTRARPLHWTSCLKIAEDVAQGLAYIHQASKLVHGNLRSSNILLGPDFEACLTDYCLFVLADSTATNDPDTARYRAPETRKSSHQATSKSDVYSFGVLLLEILTGKSPAQHPFLVPADMPDWVRAVREDDGGGDNGVGVLVEVAGICSISSPEQRPTMRRVLKMIQEIKESLMVEDRNASFGLS